MNTRLGGKMGCVQSNAASVDEEDRYWVIKVGRWDRSGREGGLIWRADLQV